MLYAVTAVLATAAIVAAFGWHHTRRALIAVRASRRLDQAAMQRDVDALLVLLDAESVLDRATARGEDLGEGDGHV